MPGYVRIGAALLMALGVLALLIGQTAIGVADLLVVGVPTWAIATVRGIREIRGDEPIAIPGDPVTPREAARLETLDSVFSGGDGGGWSGGDGGGWSGGGGDGGGGGGG